MNRSSQGHIGFSTEPKTRRHSKGFVSGERCRVFMYHLWNQGFKKECRYEILRFEFENCFETNDNRTVEKYIGRPEQVKRSSGLANVTRVNRGTGKVDSYSYTNKMNLIRKIGLMERLGYIKRLKQEKKLKQDKETRYFLHHERMPYYTEQVTLEATVPPGSPLNNVNECLTVSKDNLRVPPLCSTEGSREDSTINDGTIGDTGEYRNK